MPKLDTFILELKTGDRPGPKTPSFNINGFPLEFDELEGSAEAHQTFVATGNPMSFPHAMGLIGPAEGAEPWDIESVSITYHCMNMEPYTVRLGSIALDDESNMNLWHEPPPVTFDV